MAQKTSWQERVFTFVRSSTDAFSLDALRKAVGSAVTRRSLERFLFETKIAVSLDAKIFTPTRLIFQDALCLARPQQWEIDDGVFAPGHRLLPFYDFRVLPTELQLRVADDTSADNAGPDTTTTRLAAAAGFATRRTVVMPRTRAITYYSLFGYESIHALIGFEDQSNAAVDHGDELDALVRISVFDLGEFYRRTGFTEGDYLECRLLDWEAGIFSVTRRPAVEVTAQQRAAWSTELVKAFSGVFELFGGPMDIPTQLLYAYYLSDAVVLEHPAGTIGELLAADDNDLQIVPRGTGSSSLWNAAEPQDQPLAPAGYDVPAEGVTGDLEEMLTDIGSSLTVGEIEGYMRDALFHGLTKTDAVGRAFAGAYLGFAHEAQAESFQDEIDALWDAVTARYVPARDARTGPLRARLLDLYDRQLAFIRGLDGRGLDPSQLPGGPLRDVAEFFSMITRTIEILNQEISGDEDQDELDTLADQVPRLEEIGMEILAHAEEEVTAALGEPPAGHAPGTDDAPAEGTTTEVYEFRISLVGIRPQIWRRVRVPGSTTLARFHEIIQLVMGWEDSHLHVFRIRDTDYASTTQVVSDTQPEERYRLSDLGLKPKERFRYVYDFGDDWIHEILVSKVLDVEEVKEVDRTGPRLLSGKRAAPPEDCGGVPGYYRLLYYFDERDDEVWEPDASPEDDEEAEFRRAMVPEDWDPEYVDIEGINARFNEPPRLRLV